MDPRRLYREIVEIEKQLRELLRSNPLNSLDANVLRGRLMEKARVLTEVSPPFAAAREIEQVLWKPCFYKRIEEFRRRIRKYAAAAAADRAVREHFARVSLEFQAFLTEASRFYEALRGSWTTYLVQHRVSRIAAADAATATATATTTATADASTDKCRHSLHRCLVFLGDLARYRELHSQKAKKNFAAAEGFYHRALSVIPENGNPHNQLAVLATYVEAETVAVYRYTRSLLIAQPFATAEENLALLFERSRQRSLAPPATALVTTTSSAKDKSAYLKSFLHRLTRTHGLLFSMAMRHGKEHGETNGGGGGATGGGVTVAETATAIAAAAGGDRSNGAASLLPPLPAYSREMEALLMKDLAALLDAGVMGDTLLLKLVITNVFCVLRALAVAPRAAVTEDALRLATRMITIVMAFVVSELGKPATESALKGSKATLPSALRLLGPIATFADVLRCNPHVVDELEVVLGRLGEDQAKKFVHEFLSQLATLLNHAQVQSSSALCIGGGGETDSQQIMEKALLLKENQELRGFQPLAAELEGASTASKWRDDLVERSRSPAATPGAGRSKSPSSSSSSSSSPPPSDRDAWALRTWSLTRLGQFLCQRRSPLLYYFKGEFTTSPAIADASMAAVPTTSPANNGYLNAVTSRALPSSSTATASKPPGFTFPLELPTPTTTGQGSVDTADDFDDEVIVYQPSPALTPAVSPPHDAGSSSMQHGGHATHSMRQASSPFENQLTSGASYATDFRLNDSDNHPSSHSGMFANEAARAQDASFAGFRMGIAPIPTPKTTNGTAHNGSNSNNNNSSSSNGSHPASTLGATPPSSLGYPNFGSFSGLGAFSGQGLLGGWNTTNTTSGMGLTTRSTSSSFRGQDHLQQHSPLLSGPTVFPSPSGSNEQQQDPSRLTSQPSYDGGASLLGGLLGDMEDLDAIERESTAYQNRASSLSAFFPSTSASASSASSTASSSVPPATAPYPSAFGFSKPSNNSVRPPPPGFASSTTRSTTAPPPGLAMLPSLSSSSSSPLHPHHSPLYSQHSPFDMQTQNQPEPQPAFYTRNPFVNPQ